MQSFSIGDDADGLAAQLQESRGWGPAVVTMFVTLATVIVGALTANGSVKPDRGSAHRAGSARLRGDASVTLHGSRPMYCGWSGDSADSYAGVVGWQQAGVEAVAAADLRVAEILADQADQVAKGRHELMAALLVVLVVGIAMAMVLQERWNAAAKTGCAGV